MTYRKSITLERVREYFSYDPDTGILSRRITVGCYRAGESTGTSDGHYLQVGIDRKYFRAHRLIWFYVYGNWPERDIDHINGNGFDNRLANLREATVSQNMFNRGVQKNCKSGMKGVVRDNRPRKSEVAPRWRAYITIDKKRIHIGYFDSAEKAHEARIEASKLLHGEFARD